MTIDQWIGYGNNWASITHVPINGHWWISANVANYRSFTICVKSVRKGIIKKNQKKNSLTFMHWHHIRAIDLSYTHFLSFANSILQMELKQGFYRFCSRLISILLIQFKFCKSEFFIFINSLLANDFITSIRTVNLYCSKMESHFPRNSVQPQWHEIWILF